MGPMQRVFVIIGRFGQFAVFVGQFTEEKPGPRVMGRIVPDDGLKLFGRVGLVFRLKINAGQLFVKAVAHERGFGIFGQQPL